MSGLRWREAMGAALYGEDGFYRSGRGGPAAHFRTSVHVSEGDGGRGVFTRAVVELLRGVDRRLGRPDPLHFVDMGAGRGELAGGVAREGASVFGGRLRVLAVELADPVDRPGVGWARELPPPGSVEGLLFANEWLDNVPVDAVAVGPEGTVHYLLVGPDGTERPGPPVSGADAEWLARWWPALRPGDRAEVGLPRDLAWARAVRTLRRGCAVAADYGHTAASRPPDGTLTGFRDGREVPPIPDGSRDVTAHVAVDAVTEAAPGGELLTQREALRALGVRGERPPLGLASTDPASYVRRLSESAEATELTTREGLGGFWWVRCEVGELPRT